MIVVEEVRNERFGDIFWIYFGIYPKYIPNLHIGWVYGMKERRIKDNS